jgi:hypothetical protein
MTYKWSWSTITSIFYLLPAWAAYKRRWRNTTIIALGSTASSFLYHDSVDSHEDGINIVSTPKCPKHIHHRRIIDWIMAHSLLIRLVILFYLWFERHYVKKTGIIALISLGLFAKDCHTPNDKVHSLWHIFGAIGAYSLINKERVII